ncbi:MAG: cadmium-translocating P-type ATPase [Chlorobi bacterium CHB2]|nr:cadmium-translocating P-type ATPase [Chlorobi bacterium CHB2]
MEQGIIILQADMNTTQLRIEQMDCPTEERMIRNLLAGRDGIQNLDFNLISRTLTVQHSLADATDLVRAIATLGMEAIIHDGTAKRVELPVLAKPWWQSSGVMLAAISGVCAIAAEGLVVGGMEESATLIRAVAAAGIITGGWKVAPKAWNSLRTLTLNINFLMAIATIGAVIIGEWAEAAMVIFLFAVAELIEARSLDRARNAIRSLMELTPDRVTVRRSDVWQVVAAEDVLVNDIVRVKPGESLALDGVLVSGASALNQAPVTGESMPVEKTPGDELFAGSINGSGAFEYRVTRAVADSTINRIVQLVEQAAGNRSNSERFVDRFAGIYTPIVVAIAVLVAIVPPLFFAAGWIDWLHRALVLLVIGCPCALVISTPVTIVSGLAAAARRGILIKGGIYLELGRNLRCIALDKTGTLTEGKPHVTDVITFNNIPSDHLLHLAAAVEVKSEHPIAAAIVAEHDRHHVDEPEVVISEFSALPGRGIQAVVEGEAIWVGNHRLAHDLQVCNSDVEEKLSAIEANGKTAVVVMNRTAVLGVIGVMDTVRQNASETIAELHQLGLKTAMLTGDNALTARSVAAQLGIDDVRAELLPDHKIAAVQQLRQAHGSTGMVGDGINDAPALAGATIGFAMGAAGTNVALETADVALMEDNLRKLPEFIRLSRRAFGVLWQNIAIALGLKLIFFVLAVLGYATLWMAVFADMGASLIVVANGLRLLRGSAIASAAGSATTATATVADPLAASSCSSHCCGHTSSQADEHHQHDHRHTAVQP